MALPRLGIAQQDLANYPTSQETKRCLGCHNTYTPGIVEDWLASDHAKKTPEEILQKPPVSRTVSSQIIPDHLRLMQDSLSTLLPVANALHQKLMNVPSRQSVGYMGHWLQQIPYQDLSDRAKSAGSSFNPPLKLLQENQGDCDSKAVLLAALVRMLLPDVKLAMIYLPQHAMLALQLPVKSSDDAVTIDGREYLLLDPTGPALLPPGEIGPQYRIYTQNGQFAYRLL